METLKSSLANPAFGEADLTNCERELIHLAGSIQPHGALMVLRRADLVIQQASENAAQFFGIDLNTLLDRPAAQLGGNLEERLREVLQVLDADERRPLRFHIGREGAFRAFEGTIHRHSSHELLIVEVELLSSVAGESSDTIYSGLQDKIANAVHEFSSTLSISALSTSVVACFREMAGYDRVMVYKFDPDGHGEIIAESRDEKLDSLLGHHYPATDIPQRARDLYIRNRARVLVDTHYEPVPVLPRLIPGTGDELDMSLCYLRSMSPLHIQYLKNMGVTATLVVSLVREGKLWGLVACHHYSPKPVSYAVRAASELLGEVISTRIAALENYVQGQVDVMLRRLELRLIDATSTDGDWRSALFQQPRLLLQPLEASGVALVYDGEVMTAGDVPSTPDVRELARWIDDQHIDSVYICSSIGRSNPALASLSPIASGVLAVKLSPTQSGFLIWFRPEQVSEVTWAGDPSKPMLDNDPLKLSPRRSFAAWSEIVRGSAVRWTKTDIVLARAIGSSLAEFVLQVQVVRLLIAQHQLNQVQREVTDSADPVLIANDTGAVLYLNRSFRALLSAGTAEVAHLEDLANCFVELRSIRTVFHSLINNRRPWRGDLSVKNLDAPPLPVRMRADVVPGPNGAALGFIVILTDLTISRNAAEARRHFENAIADTQRAEELMEPGSRLLREPDEVISAILSNANLAALEITDAAAGASAVPLLEELEISTRRATSLYRQLRYYSRLN